MAWSGRRLPLLPFGQAGGASSAGVDSFVVAGAHPEALGVDHLIAGIRVQLLCLRPVRSLQFPPAGGGGDPQDFVEIPAGVCGNAVPG